MIKKTRYIDLDLPSHTLWADKNLGAKSILDPGTYSNPRYDILENNIPRRKEFYELVKNTHTIYDKKLRGRWFISKKNKNTKIFFPFGGFIRDICGKNLVNYGDLGLYMIKPNEKDIGNVPCKHIDQSGIHNYNFSFSSSIHKINTRLIYDKEN